MTMFGRTMAVVAALLSLSNVLLVAAVAGAEHVRDLEVSEGAAVSTRIGFIGDGTSPDSGPPYLIVPVGSAVDTDLSIDQTTGEIRTKVPLDRETRASYSLVAIPMSGDNVRVMVKVLDENDNAPTFPTKEMFIEFPENTPRDVKRTLNPAKDLDLDNYNTQRYNIVSGNINNAFRLSSHRERDGVLYLDLQINGFLDRETTPAYSLVIEALDGGTPPLRGEMTVNITILDVNDNQPIFNQSRYFATIPENATVGTSVVNVYATDSDADENSEIEYFINRRQSDKDNMFEIDSSTGLISVNKPLDFETKELHELVIVAKDHGMQPLETTAFVSIRVTNVNDNQPTINVIFLSDDATPKISESAQPGEFVARISVHDPDSKTDYFNINVTLSGGDGHFGLTTRDNIIYLVIVSLPLDREMKPNYTLNVVATDTGTPPLHASRTINLEVTDINDNAPEFDQSVYYANAMEISEPGTSVVQVLASDKDEGNNSAITYSLIDSPSGHSEWFQIDSRSGLVTTRAHVDCEVDPVPKLTVVATDNGFPPLSSSVSVLVTIHDVNDNEPIFDQSFYNVSVSEDEPEGHCILKVSATDPDCGVNAIVNYTLGEGTERLKEFKIKWDSGDVCINSKLDYETRNVFEFPVTAMDRGGLSTTAIVKVTITDVNDNYPIFYPRQYNVSLREGGASSSVASPVVVVVANDPDSGRFGSVTYKISAGNEAGLFRIDRNTGEIFINRPNLLNTRSQSFHHLNITATDGGNFKSREDAQVFIHVIDANKMPPNFERARYVFSVNENAKIQTNVGTVHAIIENVRGRHVQYSISSGDPNGLFRLDPTTGVIRTSSKLDHESQPNLLLNIQATSGHPPVYGHSQVYIEIKDINDNAPEFESNNVRISVPESIEVGSPIYSAHARDKDSGANALVRYTIVNGGASSGFFDIDSKLGYLTLKRNLDYESCQRHSVTITATDSGSPPLTANLTVFVEVQDVNDNSPVFERSEYTLDVLESTPVDTKIIQLVAVDLDTGNNARLTYGILPTSSNDNTNEVFGVLANSGWLYLKKNLDREIKDRYELSVIANDNGSPSESAVTRVLINVLDANDNDPKFAKNSYEFTIMENLRAGSFVGSVNAIDIDAGINAIIRYGLIPSNSSFEINELTGEITTKEALDREIKELHDIIVEARDQGTPSRSSRIPLKIHILDDNDNAPEIVDPQEDVISVREEQSPGTEVVRIRAVDVDNGNNGTVTYSILKGRDSDGEALFTIDSLSGVIRTRMVLDHEEKTIYRLAIAATDNGRPPKQSIRILRVEVLDLNDNRPTFTSSSLIFKVREDVLVGHVVGYIAPNDPLDQENNIPGSGFGHITYTITSLKTENSIKSFDIDRVSGSLVVARELDRETQSEYRLEVRALDTSTMNNPQSSAITIRVDITDVNDNAPRWSQDPVTIPVNENSDVGSVVYNFSAIDADSGVNGDVRYTIVKQFPVGNFFKIDFLTGVLVLTDPLDHETTQEYTIVVKATDQAVNASERLSSSVTAHIIVIDYNDNSPEFVVPSTTSTYLSESLSVGMMITHVVAVDKDAGDNGRVTYIISSGNDENLFALGYDTGFLTLTKPLNGIQQKYILNITATDHGTPTRQASMELKLFVQVDGENPPKFLKDNYEVSLAEDVPINTFVEKVNARSGESGVNSRNLTFSIPLGIADDYFKIQSPSGRLYTRKLLDRETKSEYFIPVYVSESLSGSTTLFDTTIIHIHVTDVNDHAPEFQPASCQRLFVPENSNPSTIHTVIAKDLDMGKNSQVTYSITNGNFGHKFSIDKTSGELKARSLDRETQAKYIITIVAQDKGNPMLQSSCNLTVVVEDQNDNDPKFDQTKYMASIMEDVAIDTSVIKVHATDLDVGANGRIIYSLTNETDWLFRIDNMTGVITTAGLFDREQKDLYTFYVVATDSGKYNARSQKVAISIQIADANDNPPIFTEYPFKKKIAGYIQPGQAVLKVLAVDEDQGTNAEIVYSLEAGEHHNKFRVNPTSGIVTITQTLASEIGKVIYLNVIATDKGNPPKNSSSLIEIIVGELMEGVPQLNFQNKTYQVTLPENTHNMFTLLQVSAVRTDGRRQKIVYNLGAGNHDNIFQINSHTGVIQVRDSTNLDFELHKSIKLVVEAKSDVDLALRGYCDVIVNLTDVNDNAPTFTQQQYSASVWEGNSKGEFVLQVVALDADEGANSRILYHIVDGNLDNAFKIEPAFSGILKTNIVLDREIRDTYRLTVIATDEGIPQMTGTTRIRINIVDINDNQPTFPPHSIITVSEATEVGTVLTAVTANDVDTYPPLVYSFAFDIEKFYMDIFNIDRFSGNVILKDNLDYERWQEYKLKIIASDQAHIADTTLTIKVTDVNDNYPQFSQISYQANLPEGRSGVVEVLAVNATDLDTNDNAKIKYSIFNPIPGFMVGADDGILRANLSSVSSLSGDIQLTISAADSGNPPFTSYAATRIKTNNVFGESPTVKKIDYKISIREDISKGSIILHLVKSANKFNQLSNFKILAGNKDGIFEVSNPSGALVVINNLDRELQDAYELKISTESASHTEIVYVFIKVTDANDNAPVFTQTDFEISISESLQVDSSIHKFVANDNDLEGTPNSQIVFDISSGNDEGLFYLNPNDGVLYVNKSLDFDSGSTEYNCVIRACDKGELPMCSLTSFLISLKDENDNEPKFPVVEYLEFVAENEPMGTTVFTAHASDSDKGLYGTLTYSITGTNYDSFDEAGKLFNIDSSSGLITTNTIFDYEKRNRYVFNIKAMDVGMKYSNVKVRIEIEGKDEFHPQFTERTYKFVLATSENLPVGYVVGHVHATDRDKGPDGRVVYQLTTQHSFFKVNRTTGAILIKKKVYNSGSLLIGREVSLVVTASSGKQGSLTNMSVVEIMLDPLASSGTNLAINGNDNATITAANGSIADWALGLLISLILLLIIFGAVFVFLHMRNKRNKKVNKPSISSEQSTNNYDGSGFDTIPIRGNSGMVSGSNNQFPPPKYDEIPPYGPGHPSSNSGAATTSELSGSEQSGSSGRGSAEDGEDGEDEEIRMINEGPLQRDSGIHRQNDDDDDNLSDVSVRNTQEYLARLGIVNSSSNSGPQTSRLCTDPRAGGSKESIHHHQPVALDSLHMFDEENAAETDITNLIYAKLNNVTGSDRTSSTDDVGISSAALGPSMEHVMAMGGFGDVPGVTHQPSMNGSLSSIVHSEEELAGSYNWDYLLDWGPQYQPLAHVFSEIARLKDDTASIHSGASGTSSIKSKSSIIPSKTIPPPLITSVAPRSITMPVLNSRNSSSHHGVGSHNQMMMLPRSPINHDASGVSFSTSTAMSPSFSPSLSPLATKSPSISPLVAPGLSTAHHVMPPRQPNSQTRSKTVDTELRI